MPIMSAPDWFAADRYQSTGGNPYTDFFVETGKPAAQNMDEFRQWNLGRYLKDNGFATVEEATKHQNKTAGPQYGGDFVSVRPDGSLDVRDSYWNKVQEMNSKGGGFMDEWGDIIKFAGLVGGISGLGGLANGAFGGLGGAERLAGGAFDMGGLGAAESMGLGAGYTSPAIGAGAGTAGATGVANMPSWWSDVIEEAGNFTGGNGGGAFDPAADFGADYFSGASDYAGEALRDLSQLPPTTNLQDLITKFDTLPAGLKEGATQIAKAAAGGDSSAMSMLKKLGLPAALVAGLFEKNTNPLTGSVTSAANGALSSAGAFAGMSPVGMQPSWQKAITTANENTGAWKPYVDKASTYTNEAAAGLPSVNLSQYMNPYLDSVLTPALREINQASDAERLRLNHLAKVSGNDTFTPGASTPSGYGVQLDLLNKNKMQRIGDTTANLYKGAFDTATGLATGDLNRKMTAGGAFNTLANTVGTQGRGDVTTLAGAGDLEAKPQENALNHAADSSKLYTSVIPGTTSAITATNKPSTLGQAVGAFGAYNAANKAGWFE